MRYRIAVPSKEGVPVYDFHECHEIALVDVEDGCIERTHTAGGNPADADELVQRLEDLGIDIIITGGMRRDILEKINKTRMNLITGTSGKTVDSLVTAFLNGTFGDRAVSRNT